ncbi:MAG: recombinase family protein [Sandaracinaceae bacterium]
MVREQRTLRCGAYARFSTDKQDELSIEAQLRACREAAKSHGAEIDSSLVFTDAAKSGESLVRGGGSDGLRRAIRDEALDCLFIDSVSRLSRDVADGAVLLKDASYWDVRVIFVSDGLDTARESDRLSILMHFLMGSEQRRAVSKDTHRTMLKLAEDGFVTGNLPYGFRAEKDPVHRKHKVALIHEPEAEIVRRIFSERAEGRSFPAIAGDLNADRIAPPRGNGRRGTNAWSAGGVRSLLLNPRYIGQKPYNQRRFRKHPDTGKRTSRRRPLDEALDVPLPHLRIVPQALWDRVQEMFEANKRGGAGGTASPQESKRSGPGRPGRPSKYLFATLLTCAECGGAISIHGGGKGRRYYRCTTHAKTRTCSNALSVRESVARERIMEGIAATLASPAAIERAATAFTRAIAAAQKRETSRTADIHSELGKTEARVGRLTEAIASGLPVEPLREKLDAEHRRARQLRAELTSCCPCGSFPLAFQPLTRPHVSFATSWSASS